MQRWIRNNGRNNGIFYSGLMMAALLLGGCMNEEDSDNGVKVSDLKAGKASVKAGESFSVEGTVTASMGLSAIRVSVWKNGVDVSAGKGFVVTQTLLVGALKAWNLKTDGNVMVVVNGAAPIGDYKVRVTAVSNDDSAMATADFKVDGTIVVTQELTLGSNQNAAGGSVDLDDLKVYAHADAKAISAKIDLYYAHSATEGDKLFTPIQAKNSGFGDMSNGPATWTTANNTVFRKLDLSESAFAAITTQESIDALWLDEAGTLVTGGGDVVDEGNTYIVRTDMAKKVLIRVTAYEEGDSGTITIKGTK